MIRSFCIGKALIQLLKLESNKFETMSKLTRTVFLTSLPLRNLKPVPAAEAKDTNHPEERLVHQAQARVSYTRQLRL